MKKNKIIITHNPQNIISYYQNHFDGDVQLYEGDELLIDLSRQIIQKAHLTNERDMAFILSYKSYKTEAQNALLKIFEESPSGVYFIILSPSKNILLPTICSRFITEKYNDKKSEFKLDFDFDNFNESKFYDFLSAYSFIERADLLELICAISKRYAHCLSGDDLQRLLDLYELAKLNAKAELVLCGIGFILLNNKI